MTPDSRLLTLVPPRGMGTPPVGCGHYHDALLRTRLVRSTDSRLGSLLRGVPVPFCSAMSLVVSPARACLLACLLALYNYAHVRSLNLICVLFLGFGPPSPCTITLFRLHTPVCLFVCSSSPAFAFASSSLASNRLDFPVIRLHSHSHSHSHYLHLCISAPRHACMACMHSMVPRHRS